MYGNQNQYQQQNGFQQPQQAASPVEMSLDSVMQGGSPGLFDKNDPVGTSHQARSPESRRSSRPTSRPESHCSIRTAIQSRRSSST